MTTLATFTKIGGAVAAALIASSLSVGTANAYACKSTQASGSATGAYKIAARKAARQNWKTSVQNQYGLSWSLWSIAAAKSVSCSKSGGAHFCQAVGRPCQYVVQ